MTKKPIDKKREAAGVFELQGPEGEQITQMLVLDDRLIMVGLKGVYETIMADKVDPHRTDINLPQTIQKQLFPYGSETPFVGRTLMTAKELFNPAHLGLKFDDKKPLSLAFEAAREFAAMAQILESIRQYQEAGRKELAGAQVTNTLKLPTMVNLESQTKSFLSHARKAMIALIGISNHFYPKDKENAPWDASVDAGLQEYEKRNPEYKKYFDERVSIVEAVQNFRHASEHPGIDKRMTVTDFSIQPGSVIGLPQIEIQHPQTPVSQMDLTEFMDEMLDVCSLTFEEVCALLCDANIKDIGPFESHVTQLPDDKRRHGVKYVYQTNIKPGFNLPVPEPLKNDEPIAKT